MRRWKRGNHLPRDWTVPTLTDRRCQNNLLTDFFMSPTIGSETGGTLMFAGEHLCKVDEKGRFLIPSPLRERFQAEGNQVMFLKNTEQTLWMYSAKEWEQVLERTRATLDEDQTRLFMHHVMAQAGASDIDKAGRVLIPSRLRKLVPMDEDQELVLVGMYHRLEIWGPSEWRRYLTRNEDRAEQDMAKIQNLL